MRKQATKKTRAVKSEASTIPNIGHDIGVLLSQLEVNKDSREVLVVPDDQRVTSDCANLFEVTNNLAQRAAAIEAGADPMIDCKGLDSAEAIALAELKAGKSPFKLHRSISNLNIQESFDMNEMTLPPYL